MEKEKKKEIKTNEKKDKKEKTNKKITIIVGIVILILIIAIISGYFAYEYIKDSKSVGTEWGDKYYLYLKDAKNVEISQRESLYGIPEQMENATIQFTETTENKEPEMVMNYTKENKEYITIYYINNENMVSYITYNEPANIELLYNIAQQRYIWYLHTSNETVEIYKSVENILYGVDNEETVNKVDSTNDIDIKETEATPEYTFSKDDLISTDENVSKFDETFIVPEVDDNNKMDFDIDVDEKEFKDNLEKTVEGYKKKEDIITPEVEKSTQDKITELEAKKEKIKKAEEEKVRLEEEMRITSSNMITKIGEHLRWFSAAYLGEIYGWSEIYTYKNVTNEVASKFNLLEYYTVYEVVGAKSKSNMENNLAQYVSRDKFSKFSPDGTHFLSRLTERDGKVYWISGGVGGGPYIDYKKSKILSSENGITKIEMYERDSLGDTLDETITVTVEYNKETSKYLITDWSVKKHY